MKTIKIEGKLRKELGKKASKTLRKEDSVPCVIYGNDGNINFYTPSASLKGLIYTPNVYLVKLDIEGKSYNAILKEIQFHPVTDKINHIDFIQFSEDKPVTMNIPVHVVGNSIGVKKGGKLKLRMRMLAIKALPKFLPDFVEVNVDNVDVGQAIKVGDLNIKNLTIVNKPNQKVVDVQVSRITATAEEGAAPAEGAEGAAPAAEGAEAAKKE
jgi:large subunit ribosomal protein L25